MYKIIDFKYAINAFIDYKTFIKADKGTMLSDLWTAFQRSADKDVNGSIYNHISFSVEDTDNEKDPSMYLAFISYLSKSKALELELLDMRNNTKAFYFRVPCEPTKDAFFRLAVSLVNAIIRLIKEEKPKD